MLLTLLTLALLVPASAPAISARSALQDPARLLRLFPVPPGARRITVAFGVGPRLLHESSSQLAFPSVAQHRLWQVRMPFAQALAYVKARRPTAAVKHFGESVGAIHVANRELTWTFRPIPHLIAYRWLSITLVKLSRRSTAIRVDAADSWSVRPPNEKVPAGVRGVTISRTRWEKTHRLSLRVTSPTEVARIIPALNVQPIAGPDYFRLLHCPIPSPGPNLTFDFRAASGRILAHAQPAGCGTLSFFVHGHEEMPLRGDFVDRVQRLLGVRLWR